MTNVLRAACGLREKLTHADSRALRKGDQVTVRTHRTVVKRQRGRGPFELETFKGPRTITAEYIKFSSIPHYPVDGVQGSSPKKVGTALQVKYRGDSLLVPLEDADERRQNQTESGERPRPTSPHGGYRVQIDRMADERKKHRPHKPRSGREQPFIDPNNGVLRADRYVPMDAVMERVPDPRAKPVSEPGRFASMFEVIFPARRSGGDKTGLALTAIPSGPGHGVGTSPSAADVPGSGYEFYADGPTIRRARNPRRSSRIGAGSMVPALLRP